MHTYRTRLTWTGNLGSGTSDYRSYARAHELRSGSKPVIEGSADPVFRGDAGRWSPEELLVGSLSQCHLLWYLHLAADGQVVVTDYVDEATGAMRINADGSGQFSEVVLRPAVTVADPAMVPSALRLHERAHELCFIARSVNFEVRLEPTASARAS